MIDSASNLENSSSNDYMLPKNYFVNLMKMVKITKLLDNGSHCFIVCKNRWFSRSNSRPSKILCTLPCENKKYLPVISTLNFSDFNCLKLRDQISNGK
jgi:hypothetical protein